jgi:hypothetical protein
MIGPETSPFIALDGPFCGAAHPLGGRPLVLGTGRPFGKRVETNQRSCGAARRTDDQAPAIALAMCADQGSPALTSQPWDGGSSNIQVYRPSETRSPDPRIARGTGRGTRGQSDRSRSAPPSASRGVGRGGGGDFSRLLTFLDRGTWPASDRPREPTAKELTGRRSATRSLARDSPPDCNQRLIRSQASFRPAHPTNGGVGAEHAVAA